MKKLFAFAILATVSVSAHSQTVLDLLKETGIGLAQDAIGRQQASSQTKQLRNGLGQILDKLNDENFDSTEELWRMPAGSTVAIELDQNDSGESDRKVIGIARPFIQSLAANVRIALSAADRQALADLNAADRGNEELRNPTQKGLATRASLDAHISVTRKTGYRDLSFGASIFERTFFRLLGFSVDFDQSQELTFYELSVSFQDSDTHEVPAGASFEVVGCDLSGYTVQFSADTNSFGLGYSRSEGDNLANGLKDAFARMVKLYRNPPTPKL